MNEQHPEFRNLPYFNRILLEEINRIGNVLEELNHTIQHEPISVCLDTDELAESITDAAKHIASYLNS